MYNLLLEVAAVINLILINFYSLYKKRFDLVALYWAFVLFALYWEVHGTGFQWSYPGYNFYIFGQIPLALIFGWCWWTVYIVLISTWVRKKLNLTQWYHPLVTDGFVATLFGGVIENIAVYLQWWTYAISRPPLLPYISINVWIGWALPVVVVIQVMRCIWENVEGRKTSY